MNNVAEGLMQIFAEFGKLLDLAPSDARVQSLVKTLQNYITEHFYTCTNEILKNLGKMYIVDERFTNNIDKYGKGTAEFVHIAIKNYCKK